MSEEAEKCGLVSSVFESKVVVVMKEMKLHLHCFIVHHD